MLNVVKALWVTFVVHWGISLVFFFGLWFFWKRTHLEFKLAWKYPLAVATLFSFYQVFTTLFGVYQNQSLNTFQQQMQADSQAQADKFRTDQAGNNIAMKQEFLKVVESVIGNPSQLTAEVKQKIFTTYAALFINGATDKQIYSANVSNVYKCQKSFMEDALATLQTRKPTKGKTREECYELDGTFFGREKLISAEAAKKEDEVMASIAKSGRFPAAAGADQEVTPEKLKQSIQAQDAAIQVIRGLFQ